MRQKALASAPKTTGHGVWVPAFAGTTKESGCAFRHCEERSDEAIHSFLPLYGLLRFARNDVSKLLVFWLFKN
jgi:hypothetical protein